MRTTTDFAGGRGSTTDDIGARVPTTVSGSTTQPVRDPRTAASRSTSSFTDHRSTSTANRVTSTMTTSRYSTTSNDGNVRTTSEFGGGRGSTTEDHDARVPTTASGASTTQPVRETRPEATRSTSSTTDHRSTSDAGRDSTTMTTSRYVTTSNNGGDRTTTNPPGDREATTESPDGRVPTTASDASTTHPTRQTRSVASRSTSSIQDDRTTTFVDRGTSTTMESRYSDSGAVSRTTTSVAESGRDSTTQLPHWRVPTTPFESQATSTSTSSLSCDCDDLSSIIAEQDAIISSQSAMIAQLQAELDSCAAQSTQPASFTTGCDDAIHDGGDLPCIISTASTASTAPTYMEQTTASVVAPTTNMAASGSNASTIRVEVVSGSGLFRNTNKSVVPAGVLSDRAGTSTVESSFVALQQRGSGTITASIDGQYLATTTSALETPSVAQSTLSLTLRTPTIYYDSDTISVFVSASPPEFGSMLTQSLSMVITYGDESKTFNCGSLSSQSGKACSKALGEEAWFGDESRVVVVEVVSGRTGESSNAVSVTLSPLPASSVSTAAIWLAVPSYPILPGKTFATTLYANTSASSDGVERTLSTWSIEIPHATSFSYVDVDSEFYDITCNDEDGTLSAVATHKAAFSSEPDSLSGIVELGTLEFKLQSSAEEGELTPAMSLTVVSMVSLASFEYVNGDTGTVLDRTGLSTDDSTLYVAEKTVVGVNAYVKNSGEQQLVNLRTLGADADETTASVVVTEVYSCHPLGGATSCQEGNTVWSEISSGYSCRLNDTAMQSIAQVSEFSCDVSFTGSETSGGDIVVAVDVESFVDFVPFRVWHPVVESAAVRTTDVVLNPITDGCDEWGFQRATLSASATFSAGHKGRFAADVTPFVDFCSQSNDVVHVNGTRAVGVAEGTATVSLCTENVDVAAAAGVSLTVSDEAVSVQQVEGVVLNGIDLDESSFSDASFTEGVFHFPIRARGTLSLTAEGDEALGFLFGTFSDGTNWLLDSGVNATSAKPDVLNVVQGHFPSKFEVPVGAMSGNGTDIVQLMWSPCASVGWTTKAMASPWVTVRMPAVVDVDLSVDEDIIYFQDDPMATLPGTAVEAVLTVSVLYEDGSQRDMSTDFRSVFSADSDVVTSTANVVTATESTTEVVTVTVSFGSYSSVTSSVSIFVAESVGVDLRADAYPLCNASACFEKSDIYRVQNNDGPFQRLILSAIAIDSLDNTFDLPLDESVELTFNDSSIVGGVASGACDDGVGRCVLDNGELSDGVVTGVGVGHMNVELEWLSLATQLPLAVHSSPVTVSDVSIVRPAVSYLQATTATQVVMEVTTTFSDGTMFVDVESDGSNEPSDWMPLDDYLEFTSSTSDIISVDTTGTLTLWNNSAANEFVSVTASSTVDSSVADEAGLAGNLAPDCFDVDFGQTGGPQFPSVGVGDYFDLTIRINTCGDILTGFQIQVYFDPDVVQAVADEEEDGSSWPGTITYTYGSPSSMVQILSSEPTSSAKGGSLVLSTLRFEVVGEGATWFSGVIVDTLSSGGAALGTTNRDVVAGLGLFSAISVDSGRRLQRGTVHTVMATMEAQRRHLVDNIQLRGDTNGDGLFTVSDLDFVKRFYVGEDLEFNDRNAQLREMDADLDGEIDTLDIVFINSALAKKFRFLLNTTNDVVSIAHKGCTFDVNATLVTDTGALVTDGATTELFLVLGDIDIASVALHRGSLADDSNDEGVVLQASSPVDGVFRTSFEFVDGAPAELSIAIVIITYEDNGGTDEQRRISFYGTSYGTTEDFSFHPLLTYAQGQSSSCTSVTGVSSTHPFTSTWPPTQTSTTAVEVATPAPVPATRAPHSTLPGRPPPTFAGRTTQTVGAARSTSTVADDRYDATMSRAVSSTATEQRDASHTTLHEREPAMPTTVSVAATRPARDDIPTRLTSTGDMLTRSPMSTTTRQAQLWSDGTRYITQDQDVRTTSTSGSRNSATEPNAKFREPSMGSTTSIMTRTSPDGSGAHDRTTALLTRSPVSTTSRAEYAETDATRYETGGGRGATSSTTIGLRTTQSTTSFNMRRPTFGNEQSSTTTSMLPTTDTTVSTSTNMGSTSTETTSAATSVSTTKVQPATTAVVAPTTNMAASGSNASTIRVEVVSGSGLFRNTNKSVVPAGVLSDRAGTSTVESSFVALQQRGSGTITASIDGQYLATTTSALETPSVAQSTLSLTLRTPTIYYDSDTISVFVSASPPEFGSMLTQSLSMVITYGDESKTFNCGSLSSQSGKACSKALGEEAWFGDESRVVVVEVVSGRTGESSNAVSVTLSPLPASSVSTAAIWLAVPSYPILPGKTFATTLYANTSASSDGVERTLSTWSIEIPHATSFSYVDVDSEFYDITCNDEDGTLSAVATHKAAFSSEPDSLSGIVELGTLEFKLQSSAEEGELTPAMSLTVVSMVSLASFEYVNGDTGTVLDRTGLSTDDSTLYVAEKTVVGVNAYVKNSGEQQLVNLRTLGADADETTASVVVTEVYSCHPLGGATSCQEGNTVWSEISSGYSCRLNDTAMQSIAQVSEFSCDVSFTGSETSGGDIVVAVDVESFVDFVPFRVWHPVVESAAVRTTDVVLNPITDGCDEWGFQRATLSASATFSAGHKGRFAADVTPFVDFCSQSNDVVHVNGTRAVGVAEGTATVSLCTENVDVAAAAGVSLTVSDEAVSVQQVEGVVLNGIDLDESSFSDASFTEGVFHFPIRARGTLSLTAEGDEALGFLFGTFSDGTNWLLDSGVNATSAKPDVLNVVQGHFPSKFEVPVGAMSGNGTDIVQLMWSPCASVGWTTKAMASPWVTVRMPAVVDVDLSVDEDIIYFQDDPMATLPGTAVEAVLTVSVLYEDGSQRDMSTDFRSVFSADSDVVTSTANVVTATESTTEVVTVTVSFGSYSSVTSSVSIFVAESVGVDLRADAYPLCNASACFEKSDIYRVQNNDGPFQRLILSAIAIDSLDNTFDLPLDESVELTFNDSSIVGGVASGACDDGVGRCVLDNGELSDGVVTGVGVGHMNVELEWLSLATQLPLAVHSSPVTVSDVSIVRPAVSYLQATTATQVVMEVTTTFSDGTMFVDVESDGSNEPSDWMPLDDYLEFTSSTSDIISVDTTGTLTLWNNSAANEFVSVTASSTVDSSVADEAGLAGNLAPDCFDVDFGQTGGPQFPSVGVGDYFDLTIRINTCGDILTGFQIQVYFDPDVVQAVADEEEDGSSWPGTITYTYGSPSSMVQILSSEPTSSAKGGSLVLSTLRFEVVGEGATWFSGVIVDTLSSGGAALGTTNRDVVAGLGLFSAISVDSGRRLQRGTVHTVMATMEAQRRHLVDNIQLRGDTNGDGLFTVSDLDFVKRFYVGEDLEFNDRNAQLREMDADLDGEIDTLDIVFINSALAKKFRFLLNTTNDVVSIAHKGCTFDVNATLVTDTGALVTDGATTELFLVLGDIDIASVALHRGSLADDSNDEGVVLQASSPVDGVFRTSFEFVDGAPAELSIAIVIITYEDNGGTDEQRRISFYGTSYGTTEDFSFHPLLTYAQGQSSSCTSVTGSTVGWGSPSPASTIAASAPPSSFSSNGQSELPTSRSRTTFPGVSTNAVASQTLSSTLLLSSTFAATSRSVSSPPRTDDAGDDTEMPKDTTRRRVTTLAATSRPLTAEPSASDPVLRTETERDTTKPAVTIITATPTTIPVPKTRPAISVPSVTRTVDIVTREDVLSTRAATDDVDHGRYTDASRASPRDTTNNGQRPFTLATGVREPTLAHTTSSEDSSLETTLAQFVLLSTTNCEPLYCPPRSIAVCEIAAAYLGITDTVADEQSRSDRPVGCWVTSSGSLRFNVGDGSGSIFDETVICEYCADAITVPTSETPQTQARFTSTTTTFTTTLFPTFSDALPTTPFVATSLARTSQSSTSSGVSITAETIATTSSSLLTVAAGTTRVPTRAASESTSRQQHSSAPATTAAASQGPTPRLNRSTSALSKVFTSLNGGSCATAQGLCALTSVSECNLAASLVALQDTDADLTSKSTQPAGCFLNEAQNLKFNQFSTSDVEAPLSWVVLCEVCDKTSTSVMPSIGTTDTQRSTLAQSSLAPSTSSGAKEFCDVDDQCARQEWRSDGLCDDINNVCACGWDGGDCCGAGVNKTFCTECQCLDPWYCASQGSFCLPTFVSDGICDDANNNDCCGWDGGDCCGNQGAMQFKSCTDCICHQTPTTTSLPHTSLSTSEENNGPFDFADSAYDSDFLLDRILCVENVLIHEDTLGLVHGLGFENVEAVAVFEDATTAISIDTSFNVTGVILFRGLDGQLTEFEKSEIEGQLANQITMCGFLRFVLSFEYDDNSWETSSPSTSSGASSAGVTTTEQGFSSSSGALAPWGRSLNEGVRAQFFASQFDPRTSSTTPSSTAQRPATSPTPPPSTPDPSDVFAVASAWIVAEENLVTVVVAAVALVALIIILIVAAWCCCCRKKKKAQRKILSRPLETKASPEHGIELQLSTKHADTSPVQRIPLPRSPQSSTLTPSSPATSGQGDEEAESDLLRECIPSSWLDSFHPSADRSTVFLKPSKRRSKAVSGSAEQFL